MARLLTVHFYSEDKTNLFRGLICVMQRNRWTELETVVLALTEPQPSQEELCLQKSKPAVRDENTVKIKDTA